MHSVDLSQAPPPFLDPPITTVAFLLDKQRFYKLCFVEMGQLILKVVQTTASTHTQFFIRVAISE